jgi:hypothetical protein
MSEFAMVIAAIGVGYKHIDERTVSILIFVFAITSIVSTYLIGYSHPLQQMLGGWLRKIGLGDLDAEADEKPAGPAHAGKDIVLLGFFLEARRARTRVRAGCNRRPASIARSRARHRLQPAGTRGAQRRGIACLYGDISHMETLHHADIHAAAIVISTIPDTMLKGTDNMRLLRAREEARAAREHHRHGKRADGGDRDVRGGRRLCVRAASPLGVEDGRGRRPRSRARVRQAARRAGRPVEAPERSAAVDSLAPRPPHGLRCTNVAWSAALARSATARCAP